MKKLIWGFLFMCLCVRAWAGMVGGSHVIRDGNVTGRARANVVYKTTDIVTAPKENTHSGAKDADESEVETEIESVFEPEPEIVTAVAPDYGHEIAIATEYIAQLKAEINQIDSEMIRCRRAKTNWTIGTVIGGAGVVGTATGAIIQTIQINKSKKNGAVVSDEDTQSEKDGAE